MFTILFITSWPLWAKNNYVSYDGVHLFKNVSNEEIDRQGYSLFYTVFMGNFTESSSYGTKESRQNSPFSLGIAKSGDFNEDLFYSTSVYISKLQSVVSDSLNKDINVDIPLEFGGNVYLGRRISTHWVPNIYAGIDFERFSSFNTDDIIQKKDYLTTREHAIVYATLGISAPFKLLGKAAFFKLGVSQTIYSMQRPEITAEESEFTGTRLMIFITRQIWKHWSAHLFFKEHSLSNNTANLTIMRYGLGIAYNF